MSTCNTCFAAVTPHRPGCSVVRDVPAPPGHEQLSLEKALARTSPDKQEWNVQFQPTGVSVSKSHRSGADEPPSLIWPGSLLRPERERLVYLDLNHFIQLARAAAGDLKVSSAYRRLLNSALRAKADGRARFPLSQTHYMEMNLIKDPRQRGDVAEIMEAVSSFDAVLSRVTIAELEIEAVLDHLLGTRTLFDPLPLVGYGVAAALGIRGGFTIRDNQHRDVTAQTRDEMGHEVFDALMAKADLDLNRACLAGPSDAEVSGLRARGYAPEKAAESSASRADYERAFVKILDTSQDASWRAGRLRDAVSARELIHEWSDALTRSVMRRSTTIGEVIDRDPGGERNAIRVFVESMPSTRVAITIKTRYHANPNHRWSTNDIHDIDALSVAVAYCDAVFTDKAARHAVDVSPELRPLDTFMPRRPEELVDWLDTLG